MTTLTKNALVLISEIGCPPVFITLTWDPKWPAIVSQLLDGQTAFDCPDVTVAVFKSRLDQMKMNIWNGKYFDGHEPTYLFHMIEYQYCGLPHVHLVARLDDANDIDDPNCEDLFTLSTDTLQQRCHALMGKNSKTYTRRMVLLHIRSSTIKRQLKCSA
jgi:hypothetical protein